MAFDYSSVKNKKRKDGKNSGFDYSSVVGKTERTDEEKREYVKRINAVSSPSIDELRAAQYAKYQEDERNRLKTYNIKEARDKKYSLEQQLKSIGGTTSQIVSSSIASKGKAVYDADRIAEIKKLKDEISKLNNDIENAKAIQDEEYYNSFIDRISASKDFEQLSQVGRAKYQQKVDSEPKPVLETLFPNSEKVKEYSDWIKDRDVGSKILKANWDEYTEEEKNLYGYILEKYPDKADDFLLRTNERIESEKRENFERKAIKMGEDHPVASTVGAFGANILSPFDYLSGLEQMAYTKHLYGEASMIEPEINMTRFNSSLNKGVTNVIEDSTDFEIGGVNAASFLYGTGMSIANSALLVSTMGPAAAGAMSLQAASSTTMDALDRGLTDEQAVQLGAAAGIAEYLGEKMSIEHFFKFKDIRTARQAIKHAVAQVGIEASEETMTTVLNSIADFIISGDKTEYATKVAFYLSEGKTQKEAEGLALADAISGLIQDTIGGAISGFFFGGAGVAINSFSRNQERKADARKAVKDLGKDRNKVLDFAMKTEEGSEVRKAAEDIVARTEKGEKVSNKEYADVLLKTDDNFAKAEIKRQLEAEAMSTGEELSEEQLDSMSTAMLKTMRGKIISETENAQIEQSKTAKNVYARNMGVDYTYGEQLSKEKKAELKETRTQQVLSEAVKDHSEGYKQTLTKAYEDYAQGNEALKMDAEDFVNEFSSFYDIGRAGVESVDRALEAYGKGNPQLTNALARAYELGRGENRAENIAQAEIKQQAIKKGVKGKIVFEGNVKNRIRNKQQAEAINFMANVLKDTTNMEYHIFASYEKNGERYYKDSNGNEKKAPNGFYNADTHQIWIDINAGSRGQGIMLYTLTHEHVHDIRVWSSEHYNELLDIAIQTFEAKGMDFEKAAQYKYESYIKNHPDYTMEDAREEVVAEMMSGLLSDEKGLAEFSKQIQQKDASLWNRIKAWFKDVIARLSKAYEDTLPESYEARMLMENKELFEKAQKVFAEAVATAGQNYKNAGVEIDTNTDSESFRVAGVEVSNEISVNDVIESGGNDGVVAKFQDRTEYEEAPKQIFTISTTNGTSKSKMLTNKDKSNKLVSVKELRDQKFKDNGFTVDEINKMNKFIKGLADYMKKARMEYRFIGLQDVYDAKIVLDPMTNRIVLSAMVKNSEYSVNFDFTKVCKKRVALQEVIEQLTREKGRKNEDGSITEVDLSPANIKSINDILAKMGFETACLGCFVESKRYAMQNFYQDLVVDVWNRLVDEVNPNAEYFGFADQNVDTSKIPDGEFFDLQNQSKAWAKKKGKAKNVEQKMREYLRDNPAARKKLTLADLATANGRTNLAKLYPHVDSLIKSKLGQSAPKSVEVFTPYNGEIDLLEARGKGDLAKYLKKIGGARSQSFSDFIITHVFDVLQKTASLSARKFTAHTYTKEIVRARLFGLTGEKHNLSVIHNIDPNVDSWNAGLGKDGQYLNADYEAYMKGESDFIQSIGVKDAINCQNTDGYSRDVGIVAVGFSYNHMMKMHDDPEIRQIIGYHASQLPVDIKDKTHLGKAADYTHVQNTLKFKGFRVVNYKTPNGVPSYATPPQDIKEISGAKSLTKSTDLTFDIKAKFEENARGKTGKARTEAAKETLRQFLDFADANNLVPVVSKAEGALGEFDIYADSEMTQNPYLTADHYIEYCMERGYLPAFFEFGLHQNYYKNIYDFDPFDRLSYNPITGLHEDSENRKAFAPQRPVHMLNEDGSLAFPDNFIEIVDEAMKGYDKQRQRETEMMPEAMEKIRAVTNSTKFQDRDSDGRELSEAQAEYFKDSKVRDENGNLLVMYHGSENDFTEFDKNRMGKNAGSAYGFGFYFTESLEGKGLASAYAYGDKVLKGYVNIKNPLSTTKKTISKEAYLEIGRKLKERHNSFGYPFYFSEIYDDARSDFELYAQINSRHPDIVNKTEDPKFIQNEFMNLGFDGVIRKFDGMAIHAVTFDSNQFKSVDNKTPTADPDIRYQLRDVEPVQPSSDKWQRTSTTSEVMARFPDLWNVTAEESDVRNPTQVKVTLGSYRKIYDFLKDEGFDGKILDASSGLGYGTKAGIEEYGFDVEDIEPYPDKKYHPKYKDYSKLNKKYDVIISNAVLNVIPQDQRDALVVKMGELLNEGGRMFINVRGKDVENASSKVAINSDLMEYYISNTGSYQKGFTKSELVAYLQDALGDGFTVTPTNLVNGVAAVVKKDNGILYQDRLSAADQNRVVILEDQIKRLKADIKEIERHYEKAQDYARAEGILIGQVEQGKEMAKTIASKDAELRRKKESYERKAKNYEDMLEAKRAKIKEIRQRRDEILAERKAAFEAYREQRNEAIRSGGTRKSIEKNAKTLMDWLLKNSDKEHVPEVLKTTVGDFLETIDFTSKRGLAGGEPTKKDQAFAQKLNSLAAMLEKQRNYMNNANEGDAENPLDCFLDLPEGFAEEIRKLADDVAENAIGGNFVINDMNSVQLAQLNKALRVLKTSISKMNRLITNAHFASVTEAARSSMLEMAEYKAHKPMNDISEQADKMLKWEMFTPVYAFKRYGSAGESIFKGIQKGWSDFAFAIDKVLKFTEGTYTDKEVEAWEKETHSIELSDGKTVTLTTAQLMSLYCLNKREQARGHIYGGGIRIADIKGGKVKIQQTEPYLVSFEDVETLISELTDRQIAVADKLQKFMTEQGSEWGNKVSMERFGYRAFTEENYFPIESDANNLIAIDPEAKANDMFRLLNMSATKSLTKGANNAIVISDIFDIFSNHMSDMAKYGSLALPILDTMKWYNYKVRYDVGDGKFRTETVQKSVERAYGKAGKSYFTNFMKDLNGVKEGGRGIGFLSKMTSNYKIASVGANLRVALLQPTSIVRASMEIEPKYILKALTKLPAAKKAESKSGIALWKSLGYYNTDIARGVREQIKGGGKTVDKIRDKTMFLVEQMDRVTFGTLWNAAEAKAKDLGYSGEELDIKTTEIFDNIIYKTQVVDSTLTRSSLMRSTNEAVKSITAFMAEPTLSYNMVAEIVYDMAKERDFSTGWQKNSKRFGKAVAVYTASSIAAAVIESIPDAFRDDDDDEWFGLKWWQAFWGERFWDGNLLSEINILEKIPLVKDFISVRKGYDIQRLDAAWMASLNKAYEINTELFNVYVKGEKPTKTTYWGNMTAYGAAYANLRALSQISGLPVSNTVRDVVAIWNTIVGRMAPSLKLKTYDDSKKK